MNKSLYTIQNDYNFLMLSIEEMEGELTDELNQALTINKTELQSKSIAYLEKIESVESYNIRVDEEIKRLQAIKKGNGKLVDVLKDNLLNAVKLFGGFNVGFTKFGTRKSEQIIVDDVNELPKEYKTRKVTETANKAELKRAIKAGESITGVELIECLNLKIN